MFVVHLHGCWDFLECAMWRRRYLLAAQAVPLCCQPWLDVRAISLYTTTKSVVSSSYDREARSCVSGRSSTWSGHGSYRARVYWWGRGAVASRREAKTSGWPSFFIDFCFGVDVTGQGSWETTSSPTIEFEGGKEQCMLVRDVGFIAIYRTTKFPCYFLVWTHRTRHTRTKTRRLRRSNADDTRRLAITILYCIL